MEITIVEFLFLIIPLIIIVIVSLMTSYAIFKIYIEEGERSIIHLSLLFLNVSIVFTVIFFAVIIEEFRLSLFLLANTIFWLCVLEISLAYLSLFINNTREIEKYIPAVVGGTVSFAIIDFIHPMLINCPTRVGVAIYLLGIACLAFLIYSAVKKIDKALVWFEDEELRLAILSLRVCQVGGILLAYTFISVFVWLLFKEANSLIMNFSKFSIFDWMVYLNLPMYLAVFLISYNKIKTIIFNKIDISEILNALDSPKTD